MLPPSSNYELYWCTRTITSDIWLKCFAVWKFMTVGKTWRACLAEMSLAIGEWKKGNGSMGGRTVANTTKTVTIMYSPACPQFLL